MKTTVNISKKIVGIIAGIYFVSALASAGTSPQQHHSVSTHPPNHLSLTQTAQPKKSLSKRTTKANRAPTGTPILSNRKANLAPSKSASQANLATKTKRRSRHNRLPTLLSAHPSQHRRPSQHRSQLHNPSTTLRIAQAPSAEMAGNRAPLAAVLAHATAA